MTLLITDLLSPLGLQVGEYGVGNLQVFRVCGALVALDFGTWGLDGPMRMAGYGDSRASGVKPQIGFRVWVQGLGFRV